MSTLTQIIFALLLLQNSFHRYSCWTVGTLSSDWGRIANIPDNCIYVAASPSLSDCIRQCVDFSKNHIEYASEDCYAYNYNIDLYSCELIHSTVPINYITSFETRWQTGLKSTP